MTETEQPAGPTAGYAGPEGAAKHARPPAGQEIDLQALAEQIYRLLKEEARLERERLGRFQAR